MNRQTGIIITIVVAAVTLCCSAVCCIAGVAIALGEQLDIGYTVEWYYGIPLMCLAILVWLAPFLTWYFLVRGKQSTGEYLD